MSYVRTIKGTSAQDCTVAGIIRKLGWKSVYITKCNKEVLGPVSAKPHDHLTPCSTCSAPGKEIDDHVASKLAKK